MSASVRIEKVIGRLTTIEKVMPVIGDTTDNGHLFEYMQVRVKQLCQSDEQLCSLFAGCSNLSNVTLSKSLETLGYYTFRGCNSLTKIEIPKSLKTVTDGWSGASGNMYGPFNSSGLQKVTFEAGITQIPARLFYGASNLKSAMLLDTITNIGVAAFSQCTSLSSINIPNNITNIGERAFSGCLNLKGISIPNSVTSIGDYVFNDCINIETATLPDIWQNIPTGLFNNCNNLKNIKLSLSVTSIGVNAFAYCSSLKNIDFPKNLTVIGGYAFYKCASLEKIVMSNNISNVGSNAFYDCDALTTVTADINGNIDSQAFYDCDALTNVSLNAVSVGSGALYDCDKLTTLELGEGVISIGNEICYSCDALKDVTFGKYITTIPDSAFRQCQSLETITLPRFCTTVAANAFAEDVKLASAYVPVSVSKIETNSFSYPAKMTMYGKSGSYAEEYAKSRDMAFNAVNAPITNIKYADSSMSIGLYNEVRSHLNIDTAFDTSVVTFSTSDDTILTVSDTGLVKGVNYGTATITATADSGKSTSIEITVLKTADRLELDKTSLSLEAGQTENLTVTMNPADAADKLNWSSSNTAVATVDGNGKVTAVGVGTAVITVTAAYSGVSASCTVEVVGDVTITATTGEHGKITPSGSVSAKSNEKTTFAIIPDYGYVVKDVQVNGTSVGAVESYTFSNLGDNATIHADFAAVNVSYENGEVAIFSEAALNNLKLIIADYDSNGAMTDCKIKTVTTSAGEEYRESVSSAANQKIMLWNNLENMRPIWIYEE